MGMLTDWPQTSWSVSMVNEEFLVNRMIDNLQEDPPQQLDKLGRQRHSHVIFLFITVILFQVFDATKHIWSTCFSKKKSEF